MVRGLRKSEKKPKKKKIMRFGQSLFWDVNPKRIHPKRHAQYIIERVMDFGNDDEVRWIWNTYHPDTLRKAVTSRGLHPQTKALWTLLLSKS